VKVTMKIYTMTNCVYRRVPSREKMRLGSRIAYCMLRDKHRKLCAGPPCFLARTCRLPTGTGAKAGRGGGFTVVEILLVVIVIALLAGVGGGIFVGTYKRMLVERSAREFALAAKYARITAIERQSTCKIVLDTDNDGFALVVYGLNEETGQTESARGGRDSFFKKAVEFPGGVEFENVQITPIDPGQAAETDEEETIVFSPNGTAQSAVIQIGDGENHYAVSICGATGKARVHFGTAEEVETRTIDLDEE